VLQSPLFGRQPPLPPAPLELLDAPPAPVVVVVVEPAPAPLVVPTPPLLLEAEPFEPLLLAVVPPLAPPAPGSTTALPPHADIDSAKHTAVVFVPEPMPTV
jgi:hypothetical protein